RAVGRIDVAVDQVVGVATAGGDLVAEITIAEQRNGDLVELDVAAAGLHEIGDLLREHGGEIGEECLRVGIGGAVGEIGEAQEVHGRRRRQRDLGGGGGGVAQEDELVERQRRPPAPPRARGGGAGNQPPCA